MNKENFFRKRSSDPSHDNLPPAPPPPLQPQQPQPPLPDPLDLIKDSKLLPEAYLRLMDYNNREKEFIKNLNESIEMDCKQLKIDNDKRQLDHHHNNHHHESVPIIISVNNDNLNIEKNNSIDINMKNMNNNECELLRDECENFLGPLLNRTGPSISAALVANDAFEQLNRLHKLLDQMLTFQEQNYQMRKYLRDVRTLCDLKKLQKKDSSELLNEFDISDTEFDLDNSAGLWNTILAAGNSASNKRSSAKRQRERSKSVIGDDISLFSDKDIILNRPILNPRRQSVFSEGKAKISKWTKVKAAFKWERANVLALNEGKSLDSGIGLTPVNNEVARYLRVPPPVPCTGSSGDSVLSGGSIPPTPGTISSASSIEDVVCASEEMRRDSSKSDSRCDSRINIDEESRRSRSLDGDMILSQVGQSKSKTPWKKVKNIIQTHKGSFKGKGRSRSIKSNTSEKESRDVSPCASLDAFDSSAQTSPTQKNQPHDDSYKIQSNNSGSIMLLIDDNSDSKLMKTSTNKLLRKSKIVSDFESLPEDTIVESKLIKKSLSRPPPSPLNLSVKLDSSDAELFSSSYSPTIFLKSPNKLLRYKKPLASGNSSVPSSPSRNSEFFGEFESEDLSSGDFSEPTTPLRKLSEKSSFEAQKEEINERYLELKEKLNQEFECKRQEWEKIRAVCCSSTSCAYQLISKEEPNYASKNIPPMLEENLTADFKKKLHKWRVKKQISTTSNVKADPNSPTKESDTKKIDWNLWKTGQIKLDGQGLTPLPDQKNLPEDFQKKLEQWKKMKETNTVPTYQNSSDSLRRSSGKFGMSIRLDGSKKTKQDEDKSDRDKPQRPERDKNKTNEKDKLEKLSKLKAIVTDPRVKEIEVQTTIGVMKFEGISRKFTRKLYEWEKARGIGPESSTFALLHPGYRPLDVGKITKENRTYEKVPNLGRSFSLDSISPNPSMLSISHQTSSLSLNDVSDLKEGGSLKDRKVASNPEMDDLNQQDEPEAVIVEVEDDIIETAAPLLTILPKIEHQTPVYKYEEIACNDYCARKFEHIEDSSKKLCDETFENVNRVTTYLDKHKDNFTENIRYVMKILNSLNESIPDLEKKIWKEKNASARNAMEIVKKLVNDLLKQLKELNEDAACCQETITERTNAIEKNLKTLQISINLVCEYVKSYSKESGSKIPKINVTSDDGIEKNVATVSITPLVFQPEIILNYQPEILIDGSNKTYTTSTLDSSEFSFNASQSQPDFSETSSGKKVNRNVSNGSKKKIRLRKMGSRQNSKTESDSSDEDIPNVVIESQRRVKRKPSKSKRSNDDDKIDIENHDDGFTGGGDDIVYVLKIKPGKPIEQEQMLNKQQDDMKNVLINPTETCIQLSTASQENLTNSANIFVKTKRKIFTTINGNSTNENLTIVQSKELETLSTSNERIDKENSNENNKNLPPIPKSPNFQRKQLELTKSLPKEPSPSIKMMIAKYNQNLESPISSGTCTPSSIRSPVLERRKVIEQTNKYEQKLNKVQKSASAGNINQNNNNLVLIDIPIETMNKNTKRLSKSYSADVLPWKNVQTIDKNSIICNQQCLQSLAWDSLKKINKNSGAISKSISLPEKKEHLFRKNREKPTSLLVGKIGALKKIDSKYKNSEYIWRRSSSSGDKEMENYPLQPDKSDNTIPRITRKLEGKAITPTEKSHPKSGDLWHPTISLQQHANLNDRPKTPLTERAKKLQRAKEEFLQRTPSRSPSIREKDESNPEFWSTHHRLSQVSGGSDTSTENCSLLKSASVGMIAIDVNNSKEIDGYESLPRHVVRSGKISSKLGFATLASKFRKVKMRSGNKEQNNSQKLNTVSALCRQSLLFDFSSGSQEINNQNLTKSKSLQISGFGTLFKSKDKDNLNKSKSTHIVTNENK